MAKHHYNAPNGVKYPLTEAKYDMAFTVYRSDRSKAKAGDPQNCLVALGIRRNKDVEDVYIGAGLDAYVIFKARDGDPAHAVHFTISTPVRRIIDGFDVNKKTATMQIILRRPTSGRTLEARREADGKRRQAIKEGTHVAQKRETKPRASRMTRLGIANRPRPRISMSGNVSVPV